MKTKPLTIEIPETDGNGFCNDDCPMKESGHCQFSNYSYWKPNIGCPWYGEGGENEYKD